MAKRTHCGSVCRTHQGSEIFDVAFLKSLGVSRRDPFAGQSCHRRKPVICFRKQAARCSIFDAVQSSENFLRDRHIIVFRQPAMQLGGHSFRARFAQHLNSRAAILRNRVIGRRDRFVCAPKILEFQEVGGALQPDIKKLLRSGGNFNAILL